MNKREQNGKGLEAPLRGHRLVGPTPELKERILRASRIAWSASASDDVPWTGPLLRLAASLVIAAIPVVFAGVLDSRTIERQPDRLPAAVPPSGKLADLWSMMGRSEFVSRFGGAASPSRCDVSESILTHRQAMEALFRGESGNGG